MTTGEQLLTEMALINQQLTGQRQVVTTELERVWQALEEEQPVLVYLPWYEQVNGQVYHNNQILVQHLHQKRVYFANPLKRGTEQAGQALGGPDEGPARQIHASGLQSMAQDEFEKRFVVGGGCALI